MLFHFLTLFHPLFAVAVDPKTYGEDGGRAIALGVGAGGGAAGAGAGIARTSSATSGSASR